FPAPAPVRPLLLFASGTLFPCLRSHERVLPALPRLQEVRFPTQELRNAEQHFPVHGCYLATRTVRNSGATLEIWIEPCHRRSSHIAPGNTGPELGCLLFFLAKEVSRRSPR